MEEDVFEIENILNTFVENDKRYYFVRWKGYGEADDTWEPEDNLDGCEDALKTFWRSSRKPKPKKFQPRKRKRGPASTTKTGIKKRKGRQVKDNSVEDNNKPSLNENNNVEDVQEDQAKTTGGNFTGTQDELETKNEAHSPKSEANEGIDENYCHLEECCGSAGKILDSLELPVVESILPEGPTAVAEGPPAASEIDKNQEKLRETKSATVASQAQPTNSDIDTNEEKLSESDPTTVATQAWLTTDMANPEKLIEATPTTVVSQVQPTNCDIDTNVEKWSEPELATVATQVCPTDTTNQGNLNEANSATVASQAQPTYRDIDTNEETVSEAESTTVATQVWPTGTINQGNLNEANSVTVTSQAEPTNSDIDTNEETLSEAESTTVATQVWPTGTTNQGNLNEAKSTTVTSQGQPTNSDIDTNEETLSEAESTTVATQLWPTSTTNQGNLNEAKSTTVASQGQPTNSDINTNEEMLSEAEPTAVATREWPSSSEITNKEKLSEAEPTTSHAWLHVTGGEIDTNQENLSEPCISRENGSEESTNSDRPNESQELYEQTLVDVSCGNVDDWSEELCEQMLVTNDVPFGYSNNQSELIEGLGTKCVDEECMTATHKEYQCSDWEELLKEKEPLEMITTSVDHAGVNGKDENFEEQRSPSQFVPNARKQELQWVQIEEEETSDTTLSQEGLSRIETNRDERKEELKCDDNLNKSINSLLIKSDDQPEGEKIQFVDENDFENEACSVPVDNHTLPGYYFESEQQTTELDEQDRINVEMLDEFGNNNVREPSKPEIQSTLFGNFLKMKRKITELKSKIEQASVEIPQKFLSMPDKLLASTDKSESKIFEENDPALKMGKSDPWLDCDGSSSTFQFAENCSKNLIDHENAGLSLGENCSPEYKLCTSPVFPELTKENVLYSPLSPSKDCTEKHAFEDFEQNNLPGLLSPAVDNFTQDNWNYLRESVPKHSEVYKKATGVSSLTSENNNFPCQQSAAVDNFTQDNWNYLRESVPKHSEVYKKATGVSSLTSEQNNFPGQQSAVVDNITQDNRNFLPESVPKHSEVHKKATGVSSLTSKQNNFPGQQSAVVDNFTQDYRNFLPESVPLKHSEVHKKATGVSSLTSEQNNLEPGILSPAVKNFIQDYRNFLPENVLKLSEVHKKATAVSSLTSKQDNLPGLLSPVVDNFTQDYRNFPPKSVPKRSEVHKKATGVSSLTSKQDNLPGLLPPAVDNFTQNYRNLVGESVPKHTEVHKKATGVSSLASKQNNFPGQQSAVVDNITQDNRNFLPESVPKRSEVHKKATGVSSLTSQQNNFPGMLSPAIENFIRDCRKFFPKSVPKHPEVHKKATGVSSLTSEQNNLEPGILSPAVKNFIQDYRNFLPESVLKLSEVHKKATSVSSLTSEQNNLPGLLSPAVDNITQDNWNFLPESVPKHSEVHKKAAGVSSLTSEGRYSISSTSSDQKASVFAQDTRSIGEVEQPRNELSVISISDDSEPNDYEVHRKRRSKLSTKSKKSNTKHSHHKEKRVSTASTSTKSGQKKYSKNKAENDSGSLASNCDVVSKIIKSSSLKTPKVEGRTSKHGKNERPSSDMDTCDSDFEFDLDDYNPIELETVKAFKVKIDVPTPGGIPSAISLGDVKKAIKRGNSATVLASLAGGLDIESQDGMVGMTLLMRAVSSGQESIVKLLISRGANVNAKDNTGNSPLMMACEQGFSNIASFLLDGDADVNAKQTAGGETALIKACRKGLYPIVCLLVSYGADCQMRGQSGLTALQWATERCHFEICEVITEHHKRLLTCIEKAITSCLGNAKCLIFPPLLPYICLYPNEGQKFTFHCNCSSVLLDKTILLYCFRAVFSRSGDVNVSFSKDNGIQSILLNGLLQTPVLKNNRSVFKLRPKVDTNKLVVQTYHSHVHLLVCIYATELSNDFLKIEQSSVMV